MQILQPIGIGDPREYRVLRGDGWMVNDDMIQRSTPNHDNVANHVMRYEIDSITSKN
jgi:hypothetical protein